MYFSQIKLKVDVKDMTASCVDADFIFSLKETNGCKSIKSCLSDAMVRK